MRALIVSVSAGILLATPAQATTQEMRQEHLASRDRVQRELTVTEEGTDAEVLRSPAGLEVEGVSLLEALEALHESSGVPIVYSPSLIPASREVTCRCAEISIGEALVRLLRGTGSEAVASDGQIIVAPVDRPDEIDLGGVDAPVRSDLSYVADDAPSLEPPPAQQQGTITGRVSDAESGSALASVQIFIEGLEVGGLSQPNGRYLLQDVPAGTHTLTAERLGYRTQTAEVTVGEGETLVQNFQLAEEALSLDEIVVTGTPGGTQRRALGNAVSQVEAGSIDNSPAVRVEQAIGNSVPGVRMMAPSGAAGGETSIRVRGSSSLALQGDPLIYVDGVRINSRKAFDGRGSATSRLQDIDPATIENIEIIKGPAAATLYGTEASNGVIQIITKRGQPGETTFQASAEVGANWQPHPARNFGLHWWEDPETGEIKAHNLYLLEQEPDRFGKPLYQYGPIQRYNVSARGGSDLFRYYAAVNRRDEEGFSRMDWTERWNVTTSLTIVPTEALTIDLNAQRTTGATRDIGSRTCWWPCWAQPATVNGLTRGSFSTYEAEIEGRSDIRNTTRTLWSAEARHNPTEWFSHRLTGGIDDAQMKRVSFTPKGGRGHADVLGSSARLGERQVWNVDTPTRTLDYSATISLPVTERLSSRTSVGLQYFERENRTVFAEGENFAVSSLETIGGASDRSSSEEFVENVTVGTYLQNEFSYQDRIFLTGAVRFDDNSAFGSDFGGAIYPKVSGSWVISEEPFFPQDFLSIGQLRLRGAWGESGQQPDAFAATRLFRPETGPEGEPILTPKAFGNPDLGPETGSEIELGFEAGFLGNRIGVDFTWYNRTTKDAIVARPIKPSVGFPGTQFVNIGRTSNWGTETLVTAQIFTRNPVRWDLDLGLTTMGNRIDDMGGLPPLRVVALSGMPSRSQFHVEGFPIAGLFTKRVVSAEFVSGNSGSVTNVMCDGGTGKSGFEMGGNPVPCENAPRVFWGQVDPSWRVHWSSTWTLFQDWRLTVAIDAQAGNVLNADYRQAMNDRGSKNFIFQDDPIFMGNQQFSRGGEAIHDAGFAKLRELTFRYALPDRFVEYFGASSASVGASWWNVATLWTEQKYMPDGQRIWDPEMQSPNFEYNGIATGAPPPMSHATFKVDVTF